MAERFEVAEAYGDETLILTLRGELDIASSPAFDARLRALLEERRTIELDLSDLSFVDSTGLRVLVNAAETASRRGGALSISAASRTVLRVVELTGLAQRLNVAAQLEQPVDGG